MDSRATIMRNIDNHTSPVVINLWHDDALQKKLKA